MKKRKLQVNPGAVDEQLGKECKVTRWAQGGGLESTVPTGHLGGDILKTGGKTQRGGRAKGKNVVVTVQITFKQVP